MMTLPHRAPLGPVLAQLGRLLGAKAGSPRLTHPAALPLPRDPGFLPDCATLTPDQAQERRYGLGRADYDPNGHNPNGRNR